MSKLAPYVIFLLLGSGHCLEAASKNDATEKKVRGGARAVLWRVPENVASRDLFFGSGSKQRQPQGPFEFVEEVKGGSNPKFEVRDSKGVTWRVKLGPEARPETAATRLVWALGYFTDEDYWLPEIVVRNLKELSRGQQLVSAGGVVREVRLERKDPAQKKIGVWEWKKNPFHNTKELDGLRVLMALINNWDLKTVNNAIYDIGGEHRYVVSDLGGTFGRTGSRLTRSKGKLNHYAESEFIKHISGKGVDFFLASRPFFLTAVYWPYYQDRASMEKVVQDIPIPHVEWIAYYLNQLSRSQLEAPFRAAGYSDSDIAAFATAVEHRINELRTIRDGGATYRADRSLEVPRR